MEKRFSKGARILTDENGNKYIGQYKDVFQSQRYQYIIEPYFDGKVTEAVIEAPVATPSAPTH